MKQMLRDCLFLPFPMQELQANKRGQISNKWWGLVLDVPGRRHRDLLIRLYMQGVFLCSKEDNGV